MPASRWLNLTVAVALFVAAGLTVRDVEATSAVASRANSVETPCESLPSRVSMHTEYVEETGTWMTLTEDGPAGVDGGLIYLLSAYRTCSR